MVEAVEAMAQQQAEAPERVMPMVEAQGSYGGGTCQELKASGGQRLHARR